MLALVDNNFAQRDGMREYLDASERHRAVITHTQMQEWHKKQASRTTRLSLKIACSYPDQIIFLRDTADLMHMSGDPRGLLLRLIDRNQTRNFASYCDTVIEAPLDDEIEAQFAAHEEYTRETMALLEKEAEKMWTLFAMWDDPDHRDGFSDAQRRQMSGLIGRGEHLSAELQQKSLVLAINQAAASFRRHNVALDKIPTDWPELANLLSFRYGAMLVSLYVYWKSEHGNSYPSNKRQILAWLNDIKIAAQATYFDAFHTGEKKLVPVYEIGLSMIKALGGFTNCGRQRAQCPERMKFPDALVVAN
jgi:hypothetical protein